MEHEAFGFDGKGGVGWTKNTLFSDNPPYFAIDGLKTETVKLWIGTADGKSWIWEGATDTHGAKTIGVDLHELSTRQIVKIRRGSAPPEEIKVELKY